MVTTKKYQITLTTQQPFRIGGKEDPLSGKDNPVTAVGGRLCVPGPSLKGALRAELERYLNETHYDKQKNAWPRDKMHLQPCIPSTQVSADEQRLINQGRYRNKACHYPCEIRDKGNARCGNDPNQAHNICPVCYLLGTQGLVGFVQTPFLFSDIRYEELYSGRMDRTSRTVKKGTNRPYQLVPPGATFKGEMEVLIKDEFLGWELGKPRDLKEPTNGDDWLRTDSFAQEKILEEFLLIRLRSINRLGGYHSKGFGEVQIEVTEQSKSVEKSSANTR